MGRLYLAILFLQGLNKMRGEKMDFIIEILLELGIDGLDALSTWQKTPKFLRLPLFILLNSCLLCTLFGLLVLGILMLKDREFVGGGFLLTLSTVLSLGLIRRMARHWPDVVKEEA